MGLLQNEGFAAALFVLADYARRAVIERSYYIEQPNVAMNRPICYTVEDAVDW